MSDETRKRDAAVPPLPEGWKPPFEVRYNDAMHPDESWLVDVGVDLEGWRVTLAVDTKAEASCIAHALNTIYGPPPATRWSIGTGGDDESGLILIADHKRHGFVARSSEMALPLVRELVDAANRGVSQQPPAPPAAWRDEAARLIAKVEECLKGVTEGPWAKDPDWRHDGSDQVLDRYGDTICFMATGRDEIEAEANLSLIANARTDLPAAVALLREAVGGGEGTNAKGGQ